MEVRSRRSRRLLGLVPWLAAVACCAGCSSAPKPSAGTTKPVGLGIPVTVPPNCRVDTVGNPTAHAFVGLEATAKSGVTERQASAAIPIPNNTTMPCASGTNYEPGPPVHVAIYFLKGASAANQDRAAGTLRASGKFSAVTVVPQS
jgi:hypothetical protein